MNKTLPPKHANGARPATAARSKKLNKENLDDLKSQHSQAVSRKSGMSK